MHDDLRTVAADESLHGGLVGDVKLVPVDAKDVGIVSFLQLTDAVIAKLALEARDEDFGFFRDHVECLKGAGDARPSYRIRPSSRRGEREAYPSERGQGHRYTATGC